MDRELRPVSRIEGCLEVPGDKSIFHRALILGALCRGEVQVSNISSAADCASTLSCLEKLGVEIEKRPTNRLLIKGRGLHGFREPSAVLDAQNSGTTIRLLSGALCGQSFYSVLSGDDSLRERPMKRIIEPLRSMGAEIFGRDHNRKPPLSIIGRKLKPIEYIMPVASAQVKSAIMIASLFCSGETTIIESFPSRDHTERMLTHLGAGISSCGNAITVRGGELHPKEIAVPGDISSAICFVVAAVLSRDSRVRIQNVGLNPTRTGCLQVLKEMGANIAISGTGTRNQEPFGVIEACSSELRATEICPDMIPSVVDEIPILSLAATQAEGKTVIRGAEELRFKESDRLRNVAAELALLGAAIDEKPDGLEITGPSPLAGTEVHSHGDHRMAMTLAIAALVAEGRTLIRDADAVAVSFPEFFDKLDGLTR